MTMCAVRRQRLLSESHVRHLRSSESRLRFQSGRRLVLALVGCSTARQAFSTCLVQLGLPSTHLTRRNKSKSLLAAQRMLSKPSVKPSIVVRRFQAVRGALSSRRPETWQPLAFLRICAQFCALLCIQQTRPSSTHNTCRCRRSNASRHRRHSIHLVSSCWPRALTPAPRGERSTRPTRRQSG